MVRMAKLTPLSRGYNGTLSEAYDCRLFVNAGWLCKTPGESGPVIYYSLFVAEAEALKEE